MTLAEVLAAPPRAFSPVSLWWWSGEALDRRRLAWQLERFAAGGVFNLVVMNLAPSGPLFGSDADDPPFFSEAWWELLAGVCDDARRLGVRLWIYDQLGFSGADLQARLVDERPDFAGRRLARAAEGADPWRLDDRTWAVARGFDYLSTEACAALIDRVHGEFERRLGDRLGTVIAGSFQDELPALGTWTAGFAEAFEQDHGYDLTARLDALFDLDRPGGARVRRDFHATRARLAEDAFFRPLAAWHERHGMLVGFDQQDPARAGHPIGGVQLYADYTRTHRWLSAPGSDHHGDVRLHASMAHLHGHERVWIEAFHSSGWGGTLEETLDWLLPWLRGGATLYDPHAVYASTKGGWWEWAPPATDWRQPYWRHHGVFAQAVARMSAALSLGRHVCDVAVLAPTATVQAGTAIDAVSDAARRAQDTYLELVGDMSWFSTRPGVLDRLGLDADVLDDEAAARAEVRGGRLRVADEAYAAVVVPASDLLMAATAERLAALARDGGRVVVYGGPAPEPLAGLATRVDDEAQLGAVLAGLGPARAAARPLVREVDGTRLVLVCAADPRASEVRVGAPDARGIDLGWLDATIDFDPGRWAKAMEVVVAGDHPTALRHGAFGGAPRVLRGRPADDGGTAFDVPFDDGPLALLVLSGEDRDGAAAAPAADDGPPSGAVALPAEWDVELVDTMDNTWGDLARPAGAAIGAQRWRLGDHHATFGARGRWAGPDGVWRDAVWSSSRGILKDPIHRETLGPKGHVPEEFLDLGEVRAGDAITFRAALAPLAERGTLIVGAPATKAATLDGAPVALDDRGHLAIAGAPSVLRDGALLELTLTAVDDGPLRAYVAFVGDAAAARRPEWLVVGGDGTLTTRFTLADGAPDAQLLVAAQGGSRVLLDGALLGVQGGFDPYESHPVPRTRRYALGDRATAGEHALTIVGEPGAAVLVDGVAVSEAHGWTTGDGAPVAVRRRPFGDPAALHLRRRAHPLPDVGWLEERASDVVAHLQLPERPAAPVELPVAIPPGATALEAPVLGAAELLLDGATIATVDGAAPLTAKLPAGAGPRTATLRVTPRLAHAGGAVLAGPVAFTTGPGRLALGDWEQVGLPEHAGGVRYRATVTLPDGVRADRAVLDLGAVRGTAEVVVDGTPVGVRVCAPWTFDVTAALRAASGGEAVVEVLVLGTLAPYLDAVSPTHFVFAGQRTAGLMGPVALHWWTTGATT
jgi:hypothetical protein